MALCGADKAASNGQKVRLTTRSNWFGSGRHDSTLSTLTYFWRGTGSGFSGEIWEWDWEWECWLWESRGGTCASSWPWRRRLPVCCSHWPWCDTFGQARLLKTRPPLYSKDCL